tara:strand:- start:1523 stop:2419 length:897 start_codon:yes stop_codon:yes gene_type:complete
MISFILPFMTKEKDKFLNLNDGFEYSDSSNIVYSTMKTIKNINSLSCEKEIILVDNSHTWSDIELPNVKVIKGWQSFTEEELMNIPEFMNHRNHKLSLENIGCDTMWASMAFHLGIKESKGDYIVLQHNDTFYHQDCLDDMIEQIEEENLEYISVDNKKIWISTYLENKQLLDKFLEQPVEFMPDNGGYVKTKKIGVSDAYFFLTKRDFFYNYSVDWHYGDTNHGATMYCLYNDFKYLHLGPYYDNPNWETEDTLHTYYYNDKPFLTHLKGGFSENKMSSEIFESEFKKYLEELENAK